MSIGGGRVDAVDHQDVDGGLGRFEFEAELILDRSEDSGTRESFGRGGGFGQVVAELETNVVGAGERCAVDDGVTESDRENAGEFGYGGSAAFQKNALGRHRYPHSAAGRSGGLGLDRDRRGTGFVFGRSQFWAFARDGEGVHWQLTIFVVRFQMETLFEKHLQHQHQLVAGDIILGPGVDGPDFGAEPIGRADELRKLDAVGVHQQEAGGGVRNQVSAGKNADVHRAVFLRGLDGSDVEPRSLQRLPEQRGGCNYKEEAEHLNHWLICWLLVSTPEPVRGSRTIFRQPRATMYR
jgi:hypothetical protein